MRKGWKILLVVVVIIAFLLPIAGAHSYKRGHTDNPFRIVAWAVYPAGWLCEQVITRPIHWLVSRPCLCNIFGHKATDRDVYYEFPSCYERTKEKK